MRAARSDPVAWQLALVLLAGLLVRLPLAWLDPHVSADLGLFRGWARVAAEDGMVAVSITTDVTHYQPIALYLIGLAGWIESQLPAVLRRGDAALNALIKLPSLLADVATAALLAWALRGHSARTRLRAAALHVFNPGVWYVSAVWGQLDALYTLFLLVAILSLRAGAVGRTWASYVLALAVKLQTIFQGPLIALGSVLRNARAALASAVLALVVYVLLAAPWWATGHAEEFARASYHRPRLLVVSAYNLWYLVRLGRVSGASMHESPLGLPLSYAWFGLLLFVGFGAFVLAIVWRRRDRVDLALAATLLAIAPFVLLPNIHERYLFPALPLLLLCAAISDQPIVRRQLWCCYGLLTFTFCYNIVTVASFAPRLWTNLVALAPPYSAHIAVLKVLALIVAAINVAVLLWLGRVFLLQCRAHTPPGTSTILNVAPRSVQRGAAL